MKKLTVVFFALILVLTACGKNGNVKEELVTKEGHDVVKSECCSDLIKTAESDCCDEKITEGAKAKVTFVELGSVNCIPCKKMQPVMEAIEKKYGDQIEVVFHDVWKPDEKKYAEQYKISLIPTQVFLDENGKEFHRHEGFYPEEEINKILSSKGLKAGN
ncbi:MAG: thioredoxin family protein [Melioribacteraceae bacterium]|nr:thioredoxin family protein [Melioribacteraceae bacterium]